MCSPDRDTGRDIFHSSSMEGEDRVRPSVALEEREARTEGWPDMRRDAPLEDTSKVEGDTEKGGR